MCKVKVLRARNSLLIAIWSVVAASGLDHVAAARPALDQMPGDSGCIVDTQALAPGDACADGRALKGVVTPVLSPDGKNVYAASEFSDAVTIFAREPDSGVIRQLDGRLGCVSNGEASTPGEGCAEGRALDLASSIAVSPDGRNAYVASFNSDAIAVFERVPQTGELRQLEGASGCVSHDGRDGCVDGRALDGAVSVVVSGEGTRVYVAALHSDSIAVFDRDLASGALHQPEGEAGCTTQEPRDGCADGRALDGAFSVSVHGSSVYVASRFSSAVSAFVQEQPTGLLRQLEGSDGCIAHSPAVAASEHCADGRALDGAFGVTVTADGRNAYVSSLSSSAIGVFSRDAGTGVLRQLSGSAGCVADSAAVSAVEDCGDVRALAGVRSISVSPDLRVAYVASLASSALSVFVRDSDTGALHQLGGETGCVANGLPVTAPHPPGDGCADARALGGAGFAVASPDGRNLYVAAWITGAIASFRVSGITENDIG